MLEGEHAALAETGVDPSNGESAHEFNPEQISQSENRCALGLCVGVDRVRLNLGLIFLQEVQDIVTFPRSARRKAAH